MQEAWSHTWNGPSYPMRDFLKKKSGRYGNQLAMPYVIAVNSSDVMLSDRDFGETLFGAEPGAPVNDSHLARGFWGTLMAPNHQRVSAVLFTINLCPPTLLMGQVYACLYLNPWADQPYEGVLTKLPIIRFENEALRPYPGKPLHELLKLSLRDSMLFDIDAQNSGNSANGESAAPNPEARRFVAGGERNLSVSEQAQITPKAPVKATAWKSEYLRAYRREHRKAERLSPEELERCRPNPALLREIRGPQWIACPLCGLLFEKLPEHLALRARHGADARWRSSAQPLPAASRSVQAEVWLAEKLSALLPSLQ